MNIRQRRLQELVQRIIKEELQNGNLPTSREFIQKMRDYLKANDLGRPSLRVKGVREKAVAHPDDVNKLVDQAYLDLQVLYESVIGKYNAILKNFNKFEIDKSKLDYQLNELENYLKELILLYGESGYLSSVFDVFNDLSKIDLNQTTLDVDIRAHEAKLEFSKNSSHKVSTRGAIAAFSLNESTRQKLVERKTLGNTQFGLSENLDEVWAEVIYTKDPKDTVTGAYEVQFQEEMFSNNIELDLHTGSPMNIQIEYTKDGTNWNALPFNEKEVKGEGLITFHFTHIHMNAIRINMTKTEADHSKIIEVKGGQETAHAYILGIRRIGFYQTGYADAGMIVSKPLSPITQQKKPFTINKVSLHVDENRPNGTEIDYYVAINPNDPEVEPEWKQISPVNRDAPKHEQIIDFKNITQPPAETFMMDPDISLGEYRMENLYANGINFYKIGEIEGKQIIEGTEKLFVGRDSWGYKQFITERPAGYVPTIEDWAKPGGNVAEDYKIIEDGDANVLLEKEKLPAGTNLMFTLGVFSRKEEESVAINPSSSDPIAVYMNGEKLYEGIPEQGTKINLLFKSGWNDLKILSYLSETGGKTTGTSISLGLFDPRDYGSYIYAKARSLEKVSLFDLRYNIKSNDYSKYAIMENGDKYMVILNHAVHGIEYDFYAQYIDGEPKQEILFKAELKRDRGTTELTPRIKAYRLRFS